MDFFKNLGKFLLGASQPARRFHPLAVRCNRCGEILRANVNLNNDLSVEFNEKGGVSGFFCRKVLQGTGAPPKVCFQTVEVELHFNADKVVTGAQAVGGKLIEE